MTVHAAAAAEARSLSSMREALRDHHRASAHHSLRDNSRGALLCGLPLLQCRLLVLVLVLALGLVLVLGLVLGLGLKLRLSVRFRLGWRGGR